ncbi:MAG: TIR domain-containing protein [Verrucomicrobia bacterium]|nr:TIR domain-containing protein [Verrucomicrobiota bacterium]
MKVFISYNKADQDWAEWIAGVIDRGGYQPIIQAWHFLPGQNFVLRMQEALADSDMTIAVLSEHYLKAEFPQPEWVFAFAKDPTGKNRRLIPVRVAKCHLPPLLSETIYIDLVDRPEQDAEHALLDGLKPSGKPARPPLFPSKRTDSGITPAPFPPNLARIHCVPNLPPHYLPRGDDLAQLKYKILKGDACIAITGQGQALGVQGMGGVGKTVLATALALDSEVRQAFPDGIYWITVGQKPDVLALQNQLLRQLTGTKRTLITELEAKDDLREALEGRTVLLVIDDAWTIDHADAFSVTGPPARLLITTRNQEVLVGLGAEEHRVDVLCSSEALKMLAEWIGEPRSEKLPPEAAEVAKECGYLPLALAMIGAMIRLRPAAWKDALGRLQRADLEAIKRNFPGYPYPDLLRAIEVSVEGLDSADRERYLDLAVFPEDQPIPELALRVLWNIDLADTRDCTTRLVARSLATWATDGTSLKLHDLQRDLIRKRRQEKLPGLHLRLVKAWDALPKLPDTYSWRWLAYHLVNAERKDDLHRLLLNVDYLQAKLAFTDTNALIADYDYLPEKSDLLLVQSAIRLSANVLARDTRQLAGQLTGRLLSNTLPSIQALLEQAAERKIWPWLRPLKSSLTAPGGSLIGTLEGHTDWVNAVAITLHGRRAVSASGDRTLRVWDLVTGETKITLQGHTGFVRAAAISPDGRYVISGSDDWTLRVWDLVTGESKMTLQGHTGSVFAVAVTFDGRLIVSGSADNTVRVWDLATGETKMTLQGHTGALSSVAVTPDDRYVVSGSINRTVRVRDLATGETKTTLQGHTGSVYAVAVTPDGLRVVSGSDDNTVRVWDLATGETKTTLQGHGSSVYAVAVTPDGRHLISGSDDWTLRVWDLETGKTKTILQGHTNSVNAVAVTPSGRHVISGSADRTLRVWDLLIGEIKPTPQGHTGWINALAVTPDGRNVVSGSDDSTLRVWDLATGETKMTLEGHTSRVRAVAVTPDGHHVISGSADRTLRVWDLVTGETKTTLHGHTGWVRAVAVTPDGRHAVSASHDKTLRVWDLATGETKTMLHGHTSRVRAVAVTPDGRHVVSGSDDWTLRVWDLATGEINRTLQGHTGWVNAAAITPDGRHVVSASRDNMLRVWHLATGEIKTVLQGHTSSVNAVAITPDGRHVVSGSPDNTLRVWDLQDGKEILAFTVDGQVTACIAVQDNRAIVAGDAFGRLHFLILVEADETRPAIGDAKFRVLQNS